MRDAGPQEEAFRALCDAHHDALYAYVLRLTHGDRGITEDLVAETMYRAWQDENRRDRRPGAVRPWLLMLARSVHTDLCGRTDEPDLARLAGGAVPSTTIVSAFNELSGLHRGVLVDLFYRGRSIDQVAAELGVPVTTVKSRVYYALRALRLVLQRQD